MATNGIHHVISTLAELEALYPEAVYPPAKVKETDRITKAYRALVEASPFCAMATSGPNGLDCSPRGDPKGFVRVLDEKTVVVPDRRGNNRIDSLRNLVADPRVALLFLIPASARRCASWAAPQSRPIRSCARASPCRARRRAACSRSRSSRCSSNAPRRSCDPSSGIRRSRSNAPALPTAGKILAEISRGKLGGEEHDRLAPARMMQTIY